MSRFWERARADMARMTKPREIEGVLDTYLIRPTGFVVVQALRNTAVTPNMVSVAAMLAGVGIGLSLYLFPGQPLGAWLVLLLMWLHSGLDAADGQLARITGKGSPLGRFIDGLCDNVTFISIYVGIVLSSPRPFLFLGLAIVAGASHSTHCALVEFERMLFLNFVYDKHDTVAEQPEALRKTLGQGSRFQRFLLRLALNYSVQQRTLLRSSDGLERAWEGAMKRQPQLRPWFARRYREAMTGRLRWWPLLGPNSHKVALVVVAFVAAYLPSPLGMLPYLLYDVVVLNLVMVALIAGQARIDRDLGAQLQVEGSRLVTPAPFAKGATA